jgi:branched-chain amino acid transport system ATP-binding protein
VSALLEVEGLWAGYDRTPVVRDLSLTVAPGEVVALLGPNGAGKTTVLMTIAGLLPALRGSVRLSGRPTQARAPYRNVHHGLGYVTDDRSLFPQLTARENLRLATRTRRVWPGLERCFPALVPLLDRPAGLLSGGEQQMLALARALAARPKLLLIDEMSMGLAPVVLAGLAPVVRRAADQDGVGVLLVEQHVPVALDIADRGLVLRHGEMVAADSTAELAADHELLRATYL